MTTQAELRRRADITVAALEANGGRLNADQNDKFYTDLVASSAFLSAIQTHQMDSNEKKLAGFGLNGRVLHAAKQTGDRLLDASKRVDVALRQPMIKAVEYMAEAPIPYEVFENNIEGESYLDTFVRELNPYVMRDIQEIILRSDTTSSDDDLNKFDGVLKLMNANIADAAGAGISPTVLKDGLLALPEAYRQNRDTLGFFTSTAQEIEYASFLSARQTGLGDAALAVNQKRMAAGVTVNGISGVPDNTIMLTDPRNIAFGLQRNVSIEIDRQKRSRQIWVILTVVMGVTVINKTASAKIINVG